MAGDGCGDRSGKPLPTPKMAPLQAKQLPLVKEDDGCSEKVFNKDSEEGFDDNPDYKESGEEGEVDDEDDGEQGKGKNEQHMLPDGFYLVEALRKKRVRQGKPQYLIKWAGWPETLNTWEPTENLLSVFNMIDEFEESLPKKKPRLSKRKPMVTKKMQPQQQKHSSVITRSKSVYYLEAQIPGHGFPKAGAKKRKSGPAKRFISVASTTNETVEDDFEDMFYCITEIVDVASHDTGLPGGEINFMVKRHNGKHMYLNNKFLKESYPRLLIKFYEKQISK